MPTQPDLAHALLSANRAVEREMLELLAQRGLAMFKLNHLTVLRELDPLRGIRTTDIAARAHVTRQAIALIVEELRNLDIVELAADPTDGRAKLVRYTEFGLRGYEQAMAAFQELETIHARRIGARRMQQLKSALWDLAGETRPVPVAETASK